MTRIKPVKTVFVALSAVILVGCAKTPECPASDFLRAYLDVIYLNKPEQMMDIAGLSEEECRELRQNAVDTEIAALKESSRSDYLPEETEDSENASSEIISEETCEKYEEAIKLAYSKAQYEVKGQEQSDNEDDTYIVSVNCKKANIFKPAINSAMNELLNMENLASGFDMDMVYSTIADCIIEICENDEIEYDTTQGITVIVELRDGEYSINPEDALELEKMLFDIVEENEDE